jgi:hypothetical protein
VTALAFAVVNLLNPFTWEGVFVPLVPNNARELFGAPVPFILGTTSPPRSEDLGTNTAVLYIQETINFVENKGPKGGMGTKQSVKGGSSGSKSAVKKHAVIEYATWFTRLPEVSADMPLSESLEREVIVAAAYFRSVGADMWVRHHTPEIARAARAANVNGSLFASSSNQPNLNLNICFISHMTVKEKRYVHACMKVRNYFYECVIRAVSYICSRIGLVHQQQKVCRRPE